VDINQTINLNHTQLVEISCEMTSRIQEYNPKVSQGEIEYELVRAIRTLTGIDFFEIEAELNRRDNND
jgi:hypothetical protein